MQRLRRVLPGRALPSGDAGEPAAARRLQSVTLGIKRVALPMRAAHGAARARRSPLALMVGAPGDFSRQWLRCDACIGGASLIVVKATLSAQCMRSVNSTLTFYA